MIKKNGFSLIEVLVCIVIIVILCSLIAPAIIAYKEGGIKPHPDSLYSITVEHYATKRLDINTDISTIMIDNQKYIIVRGGSCVSICPAISKDIQNIKAEKEQQ